MKASQITTRNRNRKTLAGSLAALTVLTFFVAGPTDARCRKDVRQVQIESRIVTAHDNFNRDLGTGFNNLSNIPRIEVLNSNSQQYRQGWGQNINQPVDLRGIYLIPPVSPENHTQTNVLLDGRTLNLGRGRTDHPINIRGLGQFENETTYNIGDTDYDRRKAERREQRRRIIEGLKGAGVIREPGQPATRTTTTRPNTNNGTGTTTKPPATNPAPRPKPKQPKVTKLPNGDVVTDYPDGRREIKMKNGDTVTTHPNGKRVVVNANGDTTETHPSGYRKTTNRYGDGKARFADGTVIDFKASGEATLTTPDGKKFHRMPGKGFKEVD